MKLTITVREGSRVANTPEAMAELGKVIWQNYGAYFEEDHKTKLPKPDKVNGKWTVFCPSVQSVALRNYLRRAQQLHVSRSA